MWGRSWCGIWTQLAMKKTCKLEGVSRPLTVWRCTKNKGKGCTSSWKTWSLRTKQRELNGPGIDKPRETSMTSTVYLAPARMMRTSPAQQEADMIFRQSMISHGSSSPWPGEAIRSILSRRATSCLRVVVDLRVRLMVSSRRWIVFRSSTTRAWPRLVLIINRLDFINAMRIIGGRPFLRACGSWHDGVNSLRL